MNQDVAVFVGSAALLIAYLVFSAKTEMGTRIEWRWPWKRSSK